jgi:hypothetical protein
MSVVEFPIERSRRAKNRVSSRRPRKQRSSPIELTPPPASAAEAAKLAFDWTNDNWALTWLPWVRMAATCSVLSKAEVCAMADEMPGLKAMFERTGHHLLDLCDLLHAAGKRMK